MAMAERLHRRGRGLPEKARWASRSSPISEHDGSSVLQIVDVDGDGDEDVLFDLARTSTDSKRPVAYLRAYLGLLASSAGPGLEAAELRVSVTDVGEDGRPDLAIRR